MNPTGTELREHTLIQIPHWCVSTPSLLRSTQHVPESSVSSQRMKGMSFKRAAWSCVMQLAASTTLTSRKRLPPETARQAKWSLLLLSYVLWHDVKCFSFRHCLNSFKHFNHNHHCEVLQNEKLNVLRDKSLTSFSTIHIVALCHKRIIRHDTDSFHVLSSWSQENPKYQQSSSPKVLQPLDDPAKPWQPGWHAPLGQHPCRTVSCTTSGSRRDRSPGNTAWWAEGTVGRHSWCQQKSQQGQARQTKQRTGWD